MSDISHFKGISVVDGDIKVNIDLDRFSKQFERAQDELDNMVLLSCIDYVPMRTALLRQRSYVPGPYARFLYMGKVMVDPDTGSPWARKDAKKVLTERKLTYGQPGTGDHWFDLAKVQHGKYWIKRVKEIGGGG